MPRLVISRQITIQNGKTSIVPTLYKYFDGAAQPREGLGFAIIESGGLKNWSFCVVDDDVVLDEAGIAVDPDVAIVNITTLADTISGARRTALNTFLSKTDFGLSAANGETIRSVITRIVTQAMGHSNGFDLDRLWTGATKT